MNIVMSNFGLVKLDERELGRFVSTYNKTPKDFMDKYSDDWIPNDLEGKYVVAVEQNSFTPNEEEGYYCFRVLSIYTPRHDQIAELMYCGHIAFVTIKDKKGKEICKLYKDDECYPQSLEDWYNDEIAWMIREDYRDEGVPPTKQEVVELIETIIKGHCQNPKLELNIKEEDIIILQGL